MINIGTYKGKSVTTNEEDLNNHHIAVIGSSGSGKTVECQRIICSAVERGDTIITFDMHGTLSDDQIFWKYKQVFTKNMHEVNIHENGIECGLFSPVCYSDGTLEDSADMVGAIVDIISDVIQAGNIQRAELRKAIKYVYETGGYDEYGFGAVDEALRSAGNKTAQVLREKLFPLTSRKTFIAGQDFLQRHKINIIRLSRFNLKMQLMIAEMLLSYIWRLANAGQFKKDKIFIFIDECQNMPSGKENALAQILSEGRKLGVNLILATQMILDGNSSAVQQRITQCGLMLYFRPAANRISMTARMIDSRLESDWSRCLRQLNVGEFIAVGEFMVGDKPKSGAIKVSAVEQKEPQQKSADEENLESSREMVVRCVQR